MSAAKERPEVVTQDVIATLREYHSAHGRMPTIKEVCRQLGIGRTALRNRLERLHREKRLVIHPRGTLPVKLLPAAFLPRASR